MAQPAVIVEWYGPYGPGLDDVQNAAADFGVGAHLLLMVLGEGDARYRCSIGHWTRDRSHVPPNAIPVDIPEDLAGCRFFVGRVVSYHPGPGCTAAKWALLRALRPGRDLNNPEGEIPDRLSDVPHHGDHYCMSLVSWFYDPDDNDDDQLTAPPPGFPTIVTVNQYEELNEWFVHPEPVSLSKPVSNERFVHPEPVSLSKPVSNEWFVHPEPVSLSKPVSLEQALRCDAEPLPPWLEGPTPRFDRSEFFGSRAVYYPGSGDDGHPVKLCARAHAAHAFVYVDYGVSEEEIRKRVHTFLGYEIEHLEEVSEETLTPNGWTQHIDRSELPRDPYRFAESTKPFALFVVLCRRETFDDTHGPRRLAILFVGGDGYATFDALYCQNDGIPAPFLIVVQDHGFGGNHDRNGFGRGGLLEKIARRCDVFPQWLLVGESSEAWHGFRDTGATPEPGGVHGTPRRLFLREGSPAWEQLRRHAG